MKSLRFALVGFLTVIIAGPLTAQTIDFIVVNKEQQFTQTGDATATPTSGEEYIFSVTVDGTDLTSTDPINSASFTPSGGSLTALNFPDGSDNKWGYNASYSSQPNMDAAYANGAYGLIVGSTPLNLTLAGDIYPSAPVATLTNNTNSINGSGMLFQNVNQALTITTSSFAEYAAWIISSTFPSGVVGYHVGLSINSMTGPGFYYDIESFFTDGSPVAQLSWTSSPGDLIAGVTYKVEMEFNTLVDLDGATYAGATAVAIYTARTTFQITAVPEPSTYAAILGALALGGVVWTRKRA